MNKYDRGRPRSEDRALEMWRLYDQEKYSTAQVGARMKPPCSGANVRAIFKLRGWPMREMRRSNGET